MEREFIKRAEAVQVGRSWQSGMMSSIRQDWGTPDQLFAFLDAEFHFSLDVCAANSEVAKCPKFWSPAEDSLGNQCRWVHTCWMNPPYGRQISRWIYKAYRSSIEECATVVCLLPARTDTSWFHDFCLKGEIRFLRGRLRFDNQRRGRCPFPSMIVIFRPEALK